MGVWTLPWSKSGERAGTIEVMTVDDPFVGAAILAATRGLSVGQVVSRVTPWVHRKRLAEGLAALRLPGSYRWYSVRRGAATNALRSGQDMSSIMLRGRWNSQRTVKIYLNEGLSQMAALRLPQATRQALYKMAVLVRPSWRFFFDVCTR